MPRRGDLRAARTLDKKKKEEKEEKDG